MWFRGINGRNINRLEQVNLLIASQRRRDGGGPSKCRGQDVGYRAAFELEIISRASDWFEV